VDWSDAKAFAAWLSRKTDKTYRLLSEAEREYVTRAGTTTPFWWGSSITPREANYDGTDDAYEGGGSKGEFRKRTVPVDTFSPNPWGLYQVHGNINEWLEDCAHKNYLGAPSDGSAWTTSCQGDNRQMAGGSWFMRARDMRSAYRSAVPSDHRASTVGFRVARNM
jgi:formylglycine-generating enzyme required for sulfatase activity